VILDVLKCHGAGNDFPLIDARSLDLGDADWARVARTLSDRAGPVGGDGLLLLTNGSGDCAFGMTMLNPDGTEAETCLNGLRCVARAGFEATGLAAADARLATSVSTVATAEPLAPGVYTVEERAGPADLSPASWPLHGVGDRLVDVPVPMLSPDWRFTAVAMPNPHLVHFADALDEAELVRIGLICEAAPPWLPNRANVSVAVPDGAGGLFVRTHERGAGLTDACGSAVAAGAVAAGLTGRIPFGTIIPVRTRGGPMRARAAADGRVTLWGNATWVWRGAVELDDALKRVLDVQVAETYRNEAADWERARGADRP